MNLIEELSGDAEVLFGDESYNASVRVSARIDQVYDFHILVDGLPEFLAFRLAAEDSSFVARLGFEREVELRAYKLKGGVLWCKPIKAEIELITGNSPSIVKVHANLVNFKFQLSQGAGENYSVRDSRSVARYGSTKFSLRSASIEIRCTEQTKLAREKLNQDGGFAITHNIVINFNNAKGVQIDELKRILLDIHRVLAFANGAWVGIHLVRGFNNEINLSYLSLTNSLCTRHQGRFGWFDAHHGHVLASVGPKLVGAFDNSNSADTFDRALYWYIRANNSAGVGIDTGIILATTALELLAKFVKQKNTLKIQSTGEHKHPSLGDKIRAAALHLKIPTLIGESTCPEFWAIKTDGLWSDIPEAIAKYRNDLVHPKARIKSQNQHALTIEMWRLSVWYLELFMLRLIGYQNVYSNRLTAKWLGEVEHVPWAGSKSS
ncbi:hypothetical protein [Aliidiomarina quisquiliarum]|uniref:hypothetical protein n=1 Tax=Aliidiomarina quisquiliarum TaxID=2938947 RepID=UPI00208FF20E|nr:hypothetical protein [Aliidiomarina quisquiliarum]MCO4322463.1 hypothetical protein [Aliidiomarina quisquiliarum]